MVAVFGPEEEGLGGVVFAGEVDLRVPLLPVLVGEGVVEEGVGVGGDGVGRAEAGEEGGLGCFGF